MQTMSGDLQGVCQQDQSLLSLGQTTLDAPGGHCHAQESGRACKFYCGGSPRLALAFPSATLTWFCNWNIHWQPFMLDSPWREMPVDFVYWTFSRRSLGGLSLDTGLLARKLQAILWRSACSHGAFPDGPCAAVAGRTPRCSVGEACIADALMPLDAGSAAWRLPRLALRVLDGSAAFTVRLDLRGARAIAARPVAEAALAAAREATLGRAVTPDVETTRCCADQRGADWWVADPGVVSLRTVTPWVLEKTPRTHSPMSVGLAQRFAETFAINTAQRLYKYAALALADSPDAGPAAERHAASLRVRDAAAVALGDAVVRFTPLEDVAPIRQRSGRNQRMFEAVSVSGVIEVFDPGPEGAAWLAALEIIGGGELTSEGFGCLEYLAN